MISRLNKPKKTWRNLKKQNKSKKNRETLKNSKKPLENWRVIKKKKETYNLDKQFDCRTMPSNSILPPDRSISVHNHRSSPWSYINLCRAVLASDLYRAITLSCIRNFTRTREKQPGEHKTQPRICSEAFWNQWPTAYSNRWNQTENIYKNLVWKIKP